MFSSVISTSSFLMPGQLGRHLVGVGVLQDVDPRRPRPGGRLALLGAGVTAKDRREGAVEGLEGLERMGA